MSLAESLFHQSMVAKAQGQEKKALSLIRTGLAAEPAMAGLWYNLSQVLPRRPAIAALHRVLRLCPDEPHSMTNAGWHHYELGEHEEALHWSRKAAEAAPQLTLPWLNLAQCHMALGNGPEAVDAARRAAATDPENTLAQIALSFALCRNGQWNEGLRTYNARFIYRMPEYENLGVPRWDGSTTDHLFVMAEQGFGDTIQFVRFVRMAALAAGGRVSLGLQPELFGLFDLPPEVELIPLPAAVPADATAVAPLMSLPALLGLSDAEIPCVAPARLTVAGQAPRAWNEPKRIGIVWAGHSDNDNDQHRSTVLETFLPLAEVPDARLISLQLNGSAALAEYAPLFEDGIERVRPTFAETARVIATLDAVVCVDTAVGHLAGTMGVPVYLLLPKHGVHFMYGYGKEFTPWYPAHTLCRQERTGDWAAPMRQAVRALMP